MAGPMLHVSPSGHVGHVADPIAHLIDEIDRHFSHRLHFMHTFVPRFDLEELETSYVLYGELPGALQKDLSIVATDNHTLEVSGKTEKFSDEAPTAKGDGGQHGKVLKGDSEHGTDDAAATGLSEESKNFPKGKVATAFPKRLLSERHVGEFHRSFNFPKPIEAAGVVASMKNGVLRVVVPKGPAPKEKKVPVRWEEMMYAAF